MGREKSKLFRLPLLFCIPYQLKDPHTLELHYRGIASGDGRVSRGLPGGA
jgi:hypothetical protein